ncbi:MAG: oligosaccharide flippase family protein [Bacteroidota bacterium]
MRPHNEVPEAASFPDNSAAIAGGGLIYSPPPPEKPAAAEPGSQSLHHRVIRAGTWTIIGHAARQILRLGSNLIMTRLLVPEMFGIMALANVLLMGLQLFSDFGLRQNIVQSRRGHDQVFLDTAWAIQVLQGIGVGAIALGIAGALEVIDMFGLLPAGSVYADPNLPAVIAALSINQVISGFESTKLITASRNLIVGKLTLIELGSQVAGLVLMLAWAFVDRSIWALVAGSLLSCVFRVVLSNIALPGKGNRWQWNADALREILGFGKWIIATSILGFLASSGDRLILGGLTDTKTLGMYSIAFFMVGALNEAIAKLIGNVLFPALSEVAREQPAMLKQTYYKFRRPLDIVTLLITGILFSAGHLVVQLLYDSRYLPVGHMLEILSIMLFGVRYTVAVQSFIALGKPKLMIPITGIQVIALYGVMPLVFAWYGIEGALWMTGGSVLMTLPMIIFLKIKLDLFDWKRELFGLPWLACGLALGWAMNQLAIVVGRSA